MGSESCRVVWNFGHWSGLAWNLRVSMCINLSLRCGLEKRESVFRLNMKYLLLIVILRIVLGIRA